MAPTLAVIPIIVNAGAAILPSILAGLASAAAMLLKPRELIRLFRRRPYVPAIILAAGLGLTLAWGPLFGPDNPARRRGSAVGAAAGQATDWTEIALELLRAEASQRTASSGLRLLWRYYPSWTDEDGRKHEDKDAMILSSPAVAGKWVYGASCLLEMRRNYGVVFCVDAATGRERWSFDTIGDEEIKGAVSSPAVTDDGKYVVIGQGLHNDTNCRLICLEADTGRLHWSFTVELHIESSPAVAGDLVVVGVGAIEEVPSRKLLSHPGYVLGVRISDGKQLWRYDLADPESSPVLADGVAYVGSGFNGQAVVALRTAGDTELKARGLDRLLWRYEAEFPIIGGVRVVDDLVIVGGGNGDFVFRDPNPAGVVLALERATGRPRWKAAVPDAVLGRPLAVGDAIICPVANGEVIALSKADGAVLWRQRISGSMAVMSAPASAGGYVFAVSKDGYLARLRLEDGRVMEKQFINASGRHGDQELSISSPRVVGDRLFVGSETGGLRCYEGVQADPTGDGNSLEAGTK